MKRLWVILTLLIIFSCEDDKDTTPPELTIVSPTSGSTIGEIVQIKVQTTDKSGILKVDFYIQNSMVLSDTTLPYEYEWNTTTNQDGEYKIKVVSFDTEENYKEIEVSVTVDNESKKPSPLDITSVEYDLEKMTVKWNQSQDSDFKQYNLYYRYTKNGTKNHIRTYTDKTVTSFDTTTFDPTKENWYFLEVVDSFGLSSIGRGKTNAIERPPTKPTLNEINYDSEDGLFKITWSENTDDDFVSYTLYESESDDMSGQTDIFNSNDITSNNYNTSVKPWLYKYYQLVVKDKWDLSTKSYIQRGDSHNWFVKTFGGSDNDEGSSVINTTDGGYLIVGYTENRTRTWLIKTDSEGNEEWNNTFYYGPNFPVNMGRSVLETIDGGYIILGEFETPPGQPGKRGTFIVKTDSQGNQLWVQKYGRMIEHHVGYSILSNNNNGYFISGFTERGGGANYFSKDKLYGGWYFNIGLDGSIYDENGNELPHSYFHSTVTRTGQIIFFSSLINRDGMMIITGDYNDQVLLMELDNENKTVSFSKQYDDGVRSVNVGKSVQQTTDGGYIITGLGNLRRQEGSSNMLLGHGDLLLIKTDSFGNEEWRKSFGGNDWDEGSSVQQTTDGGYIITGWTSSFGNGMRDLWLIKTDPNGNTIDYK